jgi:hypothetical protein
VSSAQTGHCCLLAAALSWCMRRNARTAGTNDNDSLRHDDWVMVKGIMRRGGKRGEAGETRGFWVFVWTLMTASMHAPLGFKLSVRWKCLGTCLQSSAVTRRINPLLFVCGPRRTSCLFCAPDNLYPQRGGFAHVKPSRCHVGIRRRRLSRRSSLLVTRLADLGRKAELGNLGQCMRHLSQTSRLACECWSAAISVRTVPDAHATIAVFPLADAFMFLLLIQCRMCKELLLCSNPSNYPRSRYCQTPRRLPRARRLHRGQ